MKWAALVARVLVGLVFTVFGANYFLNFTEVPPPPTPEAGEYLGVLAKSHYLSVVKVLEIVGGLMLLTGVFVPLGVVLLAPVAANVAMYEVLLAHKPGIGIALCGLLAVVVAGYWPSFRGLFAVRPGAAS